MALMGLPSAQPTLLSPAAVALAEAPGRPTHCIQTQGPRIRYPRKGESPVISALSLRGPPLPQWHKMIKDGAVPSAKPKLTCRLSHSVDVLFCANSLVWLSLSFQLKNMAHVARGRCLTNDNIILS